jgi:ligand-binding SRPBCC domain-containing protein
MITGPSGVRREPAGVELFVRRSRIAAPAAAVFGWHARPGAFERLTPPWERVRVVERTGGIEDGARVVLRMGRRPFALRWVAEHVDYVDGEQFRDVQIRGPFAHWEHTHRVEPDGPDACYLEDRIEYALPLGALGALVGGPPTRRRLTRMFDYRHRVTAQDAAAHRRAAGGGEMKILVSGSSGLIGSALVPLLTTGGHQVVRLVRTAPAKRAGTVVWNPAAGVIDAAALEGFDAVVHLAGDGIANGRWTAAKKASIHDSRVEGTRLLRTLTGLRQLPKTLIAARRSATTAIATPTSSTRTAPCRLPGRRRHEWRPRHCPLRNAAFGW